MRIEFKLAPEDNNIDSKISISLDEDMIRMRLFDCDKYITWRFKNFEKSLKKLERIKVAVDIIERELINRKNKTNEK